MVLVIYLKLVIERSLNKSGWMSQNPPISTRCSKRTKEWKSHNFIILKGVIFIYDIRKVFIASQKTNKQSLRKDITLYPTSKATTPIKPGNMKLKQD